MLASFTATAWVSTAALASRKANGPHARQLTTTAAPQPAQTATPGIAPPTLSSRAAVHNHWPKLVPARGRERTPPKLYGKIRPKIWIQSPDFDSMSRLVPPFLGGGGIWEGTLYIYIYIDTYKYIFWDPKGSRATTFDMAFLIWELWKEEWLSKHLSHHMVP